MRDSGQSDRYKQLSINYVDHHNPDLIVFDSDGEEVQRIDMTRIKTLSNLHKLCRLLGLRESCHNLNPSCDEWAAADQCNLKCADSHRLPPARLCRLNFFSAHLVCVSLPSPAYMLEQCRKSCKACAEDSALDDGEAPCVNTSPEHDCEYWSTMGECTANEAFMRTACTRSCGFCVVKEHAVPSDDDDDDFKDEL